MTGKAWAFAATALLIAGPALAADQARHREGGSRGGSASAGERHHGGSAAGAARGGGSHSQSDRGARADRGGSSRASGAESRHPVAGTGHGWRTGRYGYYSSYPYYYSSRPYYGYRPYYYGWYGVPYYDFYGSSWDYPYDSPYYRPRYSYRDTGSIRTLVEPDKTKVYVDGYYAGVADDFDGMFQRLYVSPGRHDISFEFPGYRTHRVRVYVTTDHTLKIRHDMEKGSGEATLEDLTEGREAPPYRASRDDDSEPPRGDDRYAPPPREDDRAPLDREARETGAVRIEVRPDDASIYVDGEFFGTARRAGNVTLPPGRHRVEVVRPGYRTVERDVDVRPGRTETVAIDLER